MTSITPNIWQPVGLDVTRDGYQGRLGVSYKTGQVVAAGATNGLAVLPDPKSGLTLIYAGSVNGGVYVREVDLTGNPLESDTTWRWVSMPGSGYEGSQSIGHLAISADGRYLAVGRGNNSNYNINTPGVALQVGEILPGGDIRWIPMDQDLLNEFDQELVSGLQWSGHDLIANFKTNINSQEGPFSSRLSINSTMLRNDDLQQEQHNSFHLQNDKSTPSDFRLGAIELESGELFMRSRSWGFTAESTESTPINGVELQLSRDGINWSNLQGIEELTADLLEKGDQKKNHEIQRIAIHPYLVGRNVVAFLGSSKSGKISRIDRLEIDPKTYQLLDHRHEEFNGNEIGTNQASANFSLTSNPRNADGMSVVAGGNYFSKSSFAPSLAYAGGLLQVDFGTESNQQKWTPLYGPRLEKLEDDAANAQFIVAKGQPHADSRTVAFVEQNGKQFAIQTDDGGIWALQLSESKDAQLDPDFWWRSLSTTGLNSFEVMMSDWDPISNTVISSFQDNAASFGQYGDKTFINYWYGDGEIAIARRNPETGLQDIYLSSQFYYASDAGQITKFSLNESGDIVKYNPTIFQIESPDKMMGPRPWTESGEPISDDAEFILPFEANPYNPNSIVMTGSQNIYETVDIGDKTWTFKKLLSNTELNDDLELLPTAIDNQGASGKHKVDSLYVAIQKRDKETRERVGPTKIFGRMRGNETDESHLTEFYSGNAEIITDIAHKPANNPESDDTVYWIAGGTSVRFQRKQNTTNTQQSLYWKTGSSGILHSISLSDLGIAASQEDTYGLQSVVFIPGNQYRPDQLVLGGLKGQWITELDPTDGSPGMFQSMPWQLSKNKANNDSFDSPGAHVSMTKYIPEDDLLIAGTMGKGSWIYSFSDNLGSPAKPNTQITTSEVGLQLLNSIYFDKRGNLKNDSLVFQLDRDQIKSPNNSVDLKLILHDIDQWRRYLTRLSDYEAEIRIFENDLSQEASARFNNLSPASWQLEQITNLLSGIYQSNSDDINPDIISIPLAFPKDVSQQILTITANNYLNLQPDTVLHYSIELADGSAASNNTINLNGGSGNWPETDINQLLKFNSKLANKLSENSDYTLIDSDLKLISPLTVHGAQFLENTTAGILIRNSNIEGSGMPSRGLQMDLTLQNSALPSIGMGFELDVLRDQPAPGDAKEILTILDEDQLDSWEWYDLNYNPLDREGARLYDLDSDGHADWVYLAMRDNQTTDADPTSGSIRLEQAIAADMSKIFEGQGLGDIDLTPLFSATDNQAVQLTTRARRDGVLQNTDIPLQLSASLEGQANSVNSFGMMVFNDGEPTNLDSLSGLDELKARSQILFSNLKQGDQTLSKVNDFKQQLSLVDYQQVRFFEVEGADLSELKDLDDPRLRFHEPKLLEGSKAKIQSSSGLIVNLELSHSTGDLDTLIGQQQTIAPLLDFTGLNRDMIVDASIEVSRESDVSSQVSFYRVLDTNGAVQDPISGDILLPSDPGYKHAALHEANKVEALEQLTTANNQTNISNAFLQEQSFLAPVMTLGEQNLFAFNEANPGDRSHIRMLGSNLFGFEDLDQIENPDFNDLIVSLTFTLNNSI